MWLAVCSICQWYRECADAAMADTSAKAHVLNFIGDTGSHRVHVVEIPDEPRSHQDSHKTAA